jgi:hypothetical protein
VAWFLLFSSTSRPGGQSQAVEFLLRMRDHLLRWMPGFEEEPEVEVVPLLAYGRSVEAAAAGQSFEVAFDRGWANA